MSPLLGHAASAQVLQECSLFDITRLGQMQLGITGMSLEKTYRCVQLCMYVCALCMLVLACPP